MIKNQLDKQLLETLHGIKQRCNNQNSSGYRWYGGRGIKCLIDLKDLRKLWKRDKAEKMKSPSIDRVNADDDYIFSNCRFLEKSANTRRLTAVPVIETKLRLPAEMYSRMAATKDPKISMNSFVIGIIGKFLCSTQVQHKKKKAVK